VWQCTQVIPAIWEDLGLMLALGKKRKGLEVAQVVQHLPSKCKALSSNPAITNNNDDENNNQASFILNCAFQIS
jgi:hypothetical protein